MQQSQSYVQPQPIEVVRIDDTARVRLIKDVQQQDTLYTYNEVVFNLVWRDGITDSVESDFDVYWTFGVEYMQQQSEQRSKQQEIDRLVADKQLPVELDNIKGESTSTLLALADNYEKLLNSEQENTSVQIALADVYELILSMQQELIEVKNELTTLKSNA